MSLPGRLLSVAVLASFLIGPCLSVCAGWSPSAHARMACCADKSPDEADACCGSGESRQGSDSFGTLSVAALPISAPLAFGLAADVPAPSAAVFDFESRTTQPSDSDRHVRLSVFLI